MNGLKPIREGRKPDIVVCIRCHAWCYPAQVGTDCICPRCKEMEERKKVQHSDSLLLRIPVQPLPYPYCDE